MKKSCLLFISIFIITFSTASFAHYVVNNDWSNVVHWSSNHPTPYGPPVNNYDYTPNYYTQDYFTPNYSNWNSCRSMTIPTPQVVYDPDGIIPIGNFVERSGNVYFKYLNDVFARNTWLKTKGKWYYFDMSSVMMKGFIKINGLIYYFNADGSMATGTTVINGQTHYFDATGAMVF